MHKIIKSICYCFSGIFLLSMPGCSLQAQELNARLNREQILLGEQTTLQISLVNVPTAQGYYLEKWIRWNTGAGSALELISAGPIDTLEEKGSRSFIQSFVITGFDSGTHKLPFTGLELVLNGRKTNFNIPELKVEVLPVNIEGMKALHPPRSVIAVPRPDGPWYREYGWYLMSLGILLAALLLMGWLRNRRRRISTPLPVQALPLEAELQKLKSPLPANQSEWRLWAHALDAVLRKELALRVHPGIDKADHRHWAAMLGQTKPLSPETLSLLNQYASAMDPVQFGARWPLFDEKIIDELVWPLVAGLRPASASSPELNLKNKFS